MQIPVWREELHRRGRYPETLTYNYTIIIGYAHHFFWGWEGGAGAGEDGSQNSLVSNVKYSGCIGIRKQQAKNI